MDTEYITKIVRVLKKLLEPDFKLKNDVYLNSLLTHLTDTPENDVIVDSDVLNKQHIPTWLMEGLTQWESVGKLPVPSVLSFTLNLASFICKDEQTFVMLNGHNYYERLIQIICVDEPTTAPTVKLAYIRLVSSLLEHKSGLQWIISTNYWANVMCVTLRNQTVYITKEGYKFLSRLLGKSIKINEMFCHNVVQLIMAPLSESAPCMPQSTITNTLEIREQAIYQSLCPSLTLITEILEIFLENINSDNLRVFLMFSEQFKLEKRIRNVLLIAQNEDFIFYLYKLLYIIAFYDLFLKLGGKDCVEYEKVAHKAAKLYDVFAEIITKGLFFHMIKLTYMGHIYWSYISSKMPICLRHCDDPLPLYFENQMLMLQLFPIISITLMVMGEKEAIRVLHGDELRDQYVDKILKNATPLTLRVFYQWKNSVRGNLSLFDHATLALNYLTKSKSFYSRDLAVTAFQTLIYCLRDSLNLLKSQPHQITILSKEGNYLALLLDGISTFIKEFNFTWSDTLESFCVIHIVFDFLSLPMWSTKLVVKCLKLADIAISKYMTPNMALLIDNVSDSTMAIAGPMLYAKLHDSTWEVRDSALEVVCTIANNANKKFPSFRKILLEAELPSLILKMAKCDGEAFVRATAVRCLQEFAQVSEFWCSLFEDGSAYDGIIEILQSETEGIVRCQAATLIASIYEHHDIPGATLSKFYDIMTHAATADLHWEVKVNALEFWNKVINRHLTYQGMIDGIFPNVTFSKEHRKIVTLNEPEVKKRLIKVLNQLSETGCLAVLLSALQDDCDIQVSKTATKITINFVKFLKDYNIGTCDANLSAPPSPLTPFNGVPSPPYSTTVPTCSADSSYYSMSPLSQLSQNSINSSPLCHYDDVTDNVLDEIINLQDYTLLKNVFNPGIQPSHNYVPLRFRQVIPPNDFLKVAYTDLESCANEKMRWMNGMNDFNSLLEDILKDYEITDVNSMDCY